MNDDQARRFGGLDRLWGVGTVSSLLELNVVVVGVGGVGSWAVEALARSGVGKITLIDMDMYPPPTSIDNCRLLIKRWVKPKSLH